MHSTTRHFDSIEEALGPTQQAAMRLLGRREFSAFELSERLCSKGFPPQAVERVVVQLKQRDLQSDERFVEAFVRSRKARGQGPIRIKIDLQKLAVCDELIASYLQSSDDAWVALAQQVRQKRFGDLKTMSREEKARQQRFLYSRGFSMTQINSAFDEIEP